MAEPGGNGSPALGSFACLENFRSVLSSSGQKWPCWLASQQSLTLWVGEESGEGTTAHTRLPLMATSSFGTGRCTELQVHVTEATATAAEQRDLIARLEQDLSTIQSIQRPDAEVSMPPLPCPLPTRPWL